VKQYGEVGVGVMYQLKVSMMMERYDGWG